ncbi:hypothetical protein BY458DRAFT_497488 [Sporodiniella umbellata]|nr:hypothetical protein BY458DRAFT_497488 [Sporodiniella umbellata]
MASTAVRVALRVRPLSEKERLANCTECVSFIPNEPQLLIGKDHSFTYDYVFNTTTEQAWVYESSVVPLVEKFVDGFNATILAYGQTGSGKTFSMGTALEEEGPHQGIVPRFVKDLFDRLQDKKKQEPTLEFTVRVSFLELYNEELVDLLNPQCKKKCEVQIREDVNGHIYWAGVQEEVCETPEALVKYLIQGSLGRTTGSTEMNSVSSRSHAIFSVILKQQQSEEQRVISKFHFVDLAGSERLKRTHAQGDRAREGIAINAGLLALGNVISALGDESRKSAHVPYRDSKLTRLLQDSLGGNSQTLMMACVSPSDSNFAETLSTLKYANRARNIKNKVAIQQEFVGSSVQVNNLRSQLARLTLELQALKSKPPTLGLLASGEECERLKQKVRAMADELCRVTTERDTLRMARDLAEGGDIETCPLISQYQKTISDLRMALAEAQDRLSASVQASPHASHNSTSLKKRTTHAKKRRTGTTTTITKNLCFKSTTKRQRLPSLNEQDTGDIDTWLKTTLGSIQTSVSSGLRIDAKQSISVAKNQIDRALKVLDDFKCKAVDEQPTYDCELLADDELFLRLQSDESLLADLEDLGSDQSSARRSRMFSTDTLLTEDTDFSEINPQLNRMLDQIQSDIQVNESLVCQLEKTELEYLAMRRQFETKIYALRDEILYLRQAPSQHEIKQAYEGKVKQLMNQLSDLKRRYAQVTQTIQSSRNQNEGMLRALRVNVESLKVEKKRMVKRMKEEAERVKDKLQSHEREIQRLRRKQQKDSEIKRRLEREAKQLQSTLQKKTDESILSAEKIKSLAHSLKKASDDTWLANAPWLPPLPRRASRRSGPPLALRIANKKTALDQALRQFIRSKQGAEEARQLLSRKNELAQKKQAYLSEREHLLQEEDKDMLSIDRAFRQVIDEKIERVEAEIASIDLRLQAMHHSGSEEDRPSERRVTFAHPDEADWLDIDSPEENATPAQCLEAIGKILRSMASDEWAGMMEATLDDIITLRVEEAQTQMSLQQYEKTTEELRRTLMVMKETALDCTVDYERRLKQCTHHRRSARASFSKLPYYHEDSSDADSAIDLLPEDHFQHVESLFHKIYSEHGLDLRRSSIPSSAEIAPFFSRHSQTKAPMKPSASPLAGRRGSTSSPEQFLHQLLRPSAERRASTHSETELRLPPKMIETDSQQTRRRAFSFQQPPTAPSPIGQSGHSLEIASQEDFLLELDALQKLSPNPSYELRKSAVANNVFDRLSGSHTQASQAKKRLHHVRFRHSSSSIDDLRRQWALELDKIKDLA